MAYKDKPKQEPDDVIIKRVKDKAKELKMLKDDKKDAFEYHYTTALADILVEAELGLIFGRNRKQALKKVVELTEKALAVPSDTKK